MDTTILTAPPLVSQVVAFTTATKSSQLSRTTRFVTITTSATAYVAFGDTSIVATATNGMYLAANVPTVVRVAASSFLSVLQVSAGGNLFITEWA